MLGGRLDYLIRIAHRHQGGRERQRGDDAVALESATGGFYVVSPRNGGHADMSSPYRIERDRGTKEAWIRNRHDSAAQCLQ